MDSIVVDHPGAASVHVAFIVRTFAGVDTASHSAIFPGDRVFVDLHDVGCLERDGIS